MKRFMQKRVTLIVWAVLSISAVVLLCCLFIPCKEIDLEEIDLIRDFQAGDLQPSDEQATQIVGFLNGTMLYRSFSTKPQTPQNEDIHILGVECNTKQQIQIICYKSQNTVVIIGDSIYTTRNLDTLHEQIRSLLYP